MAQGEVCTTKPNYDIRCEVCDQTPTVDLYTADGKKRLEQMGLCGPCMFGEAEMIDPENW